MTFAWSDVSVGPEANEVEVSVFGPGFGECTVIHVGSGHWIVVDSCVSPDDITINQPIPVAEQYFRALGVQIESAVRLIIATHWHDDHVRGMARLLERCRAATFCCPTSMTRLEFYEFIKAFSKGAMPTKGAKVKEFNRVLELQRGKSTRRACGSKLLHRFEASELAHGAECKVTALSPSDKETDLFLQQIARNIPKERMAKSAAAYENPNLASVVAHIDFREFSVLLGADMELHNDPQRGWNAVMAEAHNSNVSSASAYKVAHHGSSNGHHSEFITTFLEEKAHCVITPFNLGRVQLPSESDVNRIRSIGPAYITSQHKRKNDTSREPSVTRSLRESGISMRNRYGALGMVRLRRHPGANSEWSSELFGSAKLLTHIDRAD